MKQEKHAFIVILALISLVAAGTILLACSSKGEITIDPDRTGTVVTNVSDPATCEAPQGPYSHVWVTIKDVRIHSSSTADPNGSGWIDLTPELPANPKQVDLLAAGNAQCFLATLAPGTVIEAGTYQQIRVILLDNSSGATVSGNQCTGNAANCVVLAADGSVHTLQLSSEAQTGIKIPSGQLAGGSFVVEENQTSTLNIDFNACSSIVIQGNGQFRLKPVLHAGEVNTTNNAISGTVVDSATGLPISGGNIVVALEQNVSGIDRVIMQTTADSNGGFTFCPVLPGTYDVVVAAVDGSNNAFAATVTTGVQPGNSLGNVPLVTTGGAAASIAGQVTTTTGAAGTAADIQLSALQPIPGQAFSITVPLPAQSATMLSFPTASDAACPVNTFCASYTAMVPGAHPNVGAFSSGGTTYAQNTVDPVVFTVEGKAFVPMSGGTESCSPSTLSTSNQSGGGSLTVTPAASLTAETLAFTGCT
jgi:hypothetical protein